MDKIRLGDKTFKPYISEEKIAAAVSEIAEKLNAKYEDANEVPILLCVLNGSLIFTADLMKKLKFNVELCSIKLSSYDGLASTGDVREVMGLTSDVKNRTVIIVEDIVDSGRTIKNLQEILKRHEVKKSEVCTLILKPEALIEDVKLDYVALEIDNKFIVGYGLDYNELGRNIPSLYILES